MTEGQICLTTMAVPVYAQMAPDRLRCLEGSMDVKRLGGPIKTPGDSSPNVYATDRGTFLIQGYKAPQEYRERVHRLLENEDVVEIPQSLVALIKALD